MRRTFRDIHGILLLDKPLGLSSNQALQTARRLVGARHAVLLPASALAGALLMVVGDTAARTLLAPTELPTGVLVAIIGAPYFLFLMTRTAR